MPPALSITTVLVTLLAVIALVPALVIAVVAFISFLHTDDYDLAQRRKAQGLCPDCGYDLRAAQAGPCPECGAARRNDAQDLRS